jgi:tetratricopeptide (TPR) repeat protein
LRLFDSFRDWFEQLPAEAVTPELARVGLNMLAATEQVYGARSLGMLPYLRDYGRVFLNSGYLTEANDQLKRAMQIAEAQRVDPTLMAAVYNDYARYLIRAEQYTTATSTLEEARRFCAQQSCAKASSCTYLLQSQARAAYKQEQYAEAARLLEQAQQEFEQDDRKHSMFTVWEDLRVIYRELNDTPNTERAQQRLNALGRELGREVLPPPPTRAELERQQQAPARNR